MDSLLIIAGPIIVTLLTTLIKTTVPLIAKAGATNLRLLVTLLALFTTIAQAALSGDVAGIDASAIEIIAVTIVNALGAIGTYSLTPKK